MFALGPPRPLCRFVVLLCDDGPRDVTLANCLGLEFWLNTFGLTFAFGLRLVILDVGWR